MTLGTMSEHEIEFQWAMSNESEDKSLEVITESRDSFDRFGDDLCEVLLSYLTLSDCFRFECVSKQFKALLFNRQTKLVINKYTEADKSVLNELITYRWGQPCIYSTSLECVLKKCRFINEIEINCVDINDEILDIISDNCVNS